MAIAFRGSATGSTDAGTIITLPVPSSVQADDFLIAHIAYRQGDNSPVTPPAGWTLLRKEGTFPDSGGGSGWIFTRVATASEPADYQFTSQDFRAIAGGILAYSGVKNANPVDVSSASTSIASTAPSAPSIDTLYTAPRLIWFLSARDNASTDTATIPAGMTERWHVNTISSAACVSLVADQVFAGPGASGAKTGAVSPAAHTTTHMLFLNPADEFPNHPPTASAGPDRITEVGTPVVLDGSASNDTDPGDTLTYAWTHISGPHSTANLSATNVASPTFTPTTTGTDVFRLTVTDQDSASGTDDVTVSTLPVGVRYTKATGFSTSVTCAIPTDALAGDLAFFAMCSRPNSPPTVAGWHAVLEATQGSSSTDVSMFLFAKRLTAGDLGGSVVAVYDTLFAFFWTAQVVTVRGLHAGILQNAQINTFPLRSPNNFVNSVVGNAGTATYEYTITSIDDAGEAVAATTTVVGGAPNTLNSTNFVRLNWNPIGRAHHYNIYGRTNGDQRLIATITNASVTPPEYTCGYDDTGVAPGSQTPPLQAPTEWLFDGLGNDWEGTPLQERLFTTYASGRLLVFTGGQLVTPNAAAEVTDPASMSPVATSISSNDAFVLHSAYQILGAAGDIGTRIFTPTHFANAWVAIGVTLRPLNANGAPTAHAGFDQDAEIGSTVYLDASDSYDDDGDSLSYSWTQLSGTAVTLTSPSTMFPSFIMPKTTVTFRLTVTDPDGLSDTDLVTVTPIVNGKLKVKNSSNVWVPLNPT